MMKNEFEQQLTAWLQEVADGCHGIAMNPQYDMDLDFYVFQSGVTFQPKLMMIGANPGGEASYSEMNRRLNREKRTGTDLTNGTNMFLDHRDDPKWKRLKRLSDLFDGDVLRPVFQEAVMTNLVYFNTGKFDGLARRKGGREAIAFCKEKNIELIRDIVKPQNIVILGEPAKNNLKPYFDAPLEKLVVTPKEGWNIIQKSTLFGIPVYCIHHPVMNGNYNYGVNFELKKAKFEEIFAK